MKYKLVGKSGLRVSELALGTMTFGEDWGWGANYKESRKIFDAYAAAGGNFIDTANLYTNGTSEKFVGDFIKTDREKWVLATKYSLNNQSCDLNLSGNHRKNLMQSVEASLKRLQTEYIDLLWLHIWDFTTSIEEVMRSLNDLVRSGKVHYIGISDTPAWIVSAANTMAHLRGWNPFIALQIEYSLAERTPERDLIPMAKNFDLGVTPWGPLAAGLLTGKYNTKNGDKEGRLAIEKESFTKEDLAIAQTVVDVAKEIGSTPSQVALNWIAQQGYNMFPIVGARTLAQIQDNLKYADFTLTKEQLKKLNDISAISLGFPHDFYRSDRVQDFAFGGSLRTLTT